MANADLRELFPAMTPVETPPALIRINGCGMSLSGARDHHDASGTHVANWCFFLLFVPILRLRAYRVTQSMRGAWYFIGREPLARKDKVWNGAVLSAFAVAILGLLLYRYTTTLAYHASRQMAAARSLVANGHPGQGAKIYQVLAMAGAEQSASAAAALNDLVQNPASAPLPEMAEVFAAAAQVVRHGQSVLTRATVTDRAMRLADEKGPADPGGAVALLKAVRPLLIDTRPLDERRLALLRAWVAREPANLDAIVPLASSLAEAGKLDEARNLLLPQKDRLGDGDGARVLGTVLGRQGEFNGAYALLWPYVQPRLERLRSAEKTAEDTIQQYSQRETKRVHEDTDLYAKLKAASDAQKRELIHAYLHGGLRQDPAYIASQEALQQELQVVPVALELGIVMLRRAQDQPDPAARKAQLEATEGVFRAIGGAAGESDAYRLSLAKVYYWLGKQAEGRKLFDEYLASKNRLPQALIDVAMIYRPLGLRDETRALTEEAYAKATKPEEKNEAASIRALVYDSVDEQLIWLNRSDPNDALTKAELAVSTGRKALQEGREDEALHQFEAAIPLYAAIPQSGTTLNQSALAYYCIFEINREAKTFEQCIDRLQRAVDADPTDSAMQINAGSIMLEGALAEVAGSEVDLGALHKVGYVGLLNYLYRDEAGRAALTARVKAHPGVIRAIAYLEKGTVLAPQNVHTYRDLHELYRFMRDDTALRALQQRAAVNLALADLPTSQKDRNSGTSDTKLRAADESDVKRGEQRIAKLRVKGGITLAIALDDQVKALMQLDKLGVPADVEQLAALADEAYRIAPSQATQAARLATLLTRAAHTLDRDNPQIAAYHARCRRFLNPSTLLAALASEPGPLQQPVLQNPDVQTAIQIVKDSNRTISDSASPFDWALLKAADPDAAAAAADQIRQSPLAKLDTSLSFLTNPYSADGAMRSYWMLQITGDPSPRSAFQPLIDAGIKLLPPLSDRP